MPLNAEDMSFHLEPIFSPIPLDSKYFAPPTKLSGLC